MKNGEKIYRGSRWTDWFSTIQNNIAEQKFRHIINSTLSMSNLELKDQMILEKEVFDFDYLTLSMKDIEVITGCMFAGKTTKLINNTR